MIGRNDSVASRFLEKNPEMFIADCPCHLSHIAASHANNAFSNVLGLNVEDFYVDCFYWFEKSSKRKGKLLEYFEFCNQEYQAILKHLHVRWLSLRCMERILKKFPSLRSYFASEESTDQQFQRLSQVFDNPLLEPALLFKTSSISLFTTFNLLLQRDEPTIPVLKPAIETLGKNIGSIAELNLDNEEMFLEPKSLFLGGTTKFTLNRLHNNGTISDSDYKKLHSAVHHYFKKYILEKFPVNNDVLCNAVWVDVLHRIDARWDHVQFFLETFSSLPLLQDMNFDELYDEFVDYQTLTDECIGKQVWEEAKVIDDYDEDGNGIVRHRVDILWWHLGQLKVRETPPNCRFRQLSKVAEIVLVIPHSNAEQERLFSIVRKNKTDSPSKLKLDGTLSSILTMKSQYPEASTPFYKWKPSDQILKDSKKAAITYNKKHD